jgi:hypothetical protein
MSLTECTLHQSVIAFITLGDCGWFLQMEIQNSVVRNTGCEASHSTSRHVETLVRTAEAFGGNVSYPTVTLVDRVIRVIKTYHWNTIGKLLLNLVPRVIQRYCCNSFNSSQGWVRYGKRFRHIPFWCVRCLRFRQKLFFVTSKLAFYDCFFFRHPQSLDMS